MRGNNLSIGKFAAVSTFIIFLMGLSIATLTVSGDISEDSGEVYTTGYISLDDNDGQKIGLAKGEDLELETVEKHISEFEGFDETRPDAGEKVELGVIYSEDGDVEFGDEVTYIDGDSGEEIDSYSNLNVYSRSDGTYYFRIPDYNPSANYNDMIKIEGQFEDTFTQSVELTEKFDFEEGYGAVTLYDSVENEEKTVYVDNSGPEINSAEVGETKDTINVDIGLVGPAPIDEEVLRNDQENIKTELFELIARQTDLGLDEPEIDDIEFNEEELTFNLTLKEKLEYSDEVDVEPSDTIQDVMSNEIVASTKTVDGLYSAAPEIDKFELRNSEVTHGDTVKADLQVSSLYEPDFEFSTGSLDIIDKDYDLDSHPVEITVELEYTSGSSGEQEIEFTVSNENGEKDGSDTVEVLTGSGSVNEILLYDDDKNGRIDQAEIKFDEDVNTGTFEEDQWFMNGEPLNLNSHDEPADSITLEAEEDGVNSTDAGDVDVTHEPGVDEYLAYEVGTRVEQLSAGDISEKDKAGPVLKDIKVMEDYNFGVLEFSEPVDSIEESPWDSEIVSENGEETERAVVEFSDLTEDDIEGDKTWNIKASDGKGNTVESTSGMTRSDLIGLKSGWNLISLPEKGEIDNNNEDTAMSSDFDWIDSAFNYVEGWQIANSLTPNKGTYIYAEGAGVLEFSPDEDGKSAMVPGDLADGWNLLSPFEFADDEIGFFTDDDICEGDYSIVLEEDVDDPCDGDEFNQETSVFNGYWVQ